MSFRFLPVVQLKHLSTEPSSRVKVCMHYERKWSKIMLQLSILCVLGVHPLKSPPCSQPTISKMRTLAFAGLLGVASAGLGNKQKLQNHIARKTSHLPDTLRNLVRAGLQPLLDARPQAVWEAAGALKSTDSQWCPNSRWVNRRAKLERGPLLSLQKRPGFSG